jgi:hypothetical protein
MENLMEMEYVINGEKYLVTVTKVEEKTKEREEILDVENLSAISDFETTETVEVENNDLIQLSISLVPSGMDLDTWLEVIKEYGVILTD